MKNKVYNVYMYSTILLVLSANSNRLGLLVCVCVCTINWDCYTNRQSIGIATHIGNQLGLLHK